MALAYAEAGIPVFPCIPGGKRPATPNAFRDATTDINAIHRWYEIADYNLALCPEDAGWCVVDIDLPEPPPDLDLPATRTVATPSGGLHLYYEGSLPPSASRLAPHVDIRGRTSYVLVPPSVVDGKAYRLVADAEIAPLPAWLGEKLAHRELPHLTAPDGVVLDAEWSVDLVKAELQELVHRGDVAIEGQGGDDRTYRLAAHLFEMGLGPEMAETMMLAHWAPYCEPPWEPEELATVVEHAWRYKQNEAGSKALPDPASWNVEQYAPPPIETTRRRFSTRKPSEDANQPPLDYWDADNTLPRVPGGCAGLAYGARSSHKTGLVLKKFADAAFDKGAKVLYIAAEGAHGIWRMRLPKLCDQRNRTIGELDDRWRTLSIAPNLLNPADIAEIVAEYRQFSPDLIALDTITRAVPGADINSPAVGVGIVLGMEALASAFNATVLGITHPGKDASRGAIGSKLVEDLSFFVWQVSHEAGVVRAWIDKMKEGPAEFAVPYRVETGGVPVVVDMSAEERALVLKGGPTHDETRDRVFEHVYNRVIIGETVSLNNSGWGSAVISGDVGASEADVKRCLNELTARGWLIKGTKGDGYQLGPSHRRPGSLSD